MLEFAVPEDPEWVALELLSAHQQARVHQVAEPYKQRLEEQALQLDEIHVRNGPAGPMARLTGGTRLVREDGRILIHAFQTIQQFVW